MASLRGGAPRTARLPRQRQQNQIAHGWCYGRCSSRKPTTVRERKWTVAELAERLDLGGIEDRKIRPLRTYKPPRQTLRRQLIGLVEHLFVDYTVQGFLYSACLREEMPFDNLHPLYRRWLVALGQGESFPRLAQPLLTAREAHLFLFAPPENRIHENIWWARMKAMGLPDPAVAHLTERIFAYIPPDDLGPALAETIRFYARFGGEMDHSEWTEVTDCLSWKLRNEPKFVMRGRTTASMLRLASEWRREMQTAKLHRIIEWTGLQISDWALESQDRLWTVTELHTNRELLYEGRKQHHCVFSYVEHCKSGCSAIFSLRCYGPAAPGSDQRPELSRITVEVNRNRAIVQARGPSNRAPSAEEWRVLRRWTADKGVAIGS